MSKADQMFKDLGFEKEETETCINYYQYNEVICFDKENHTVSCGDEENFIIDISTSLLLAICEFYKEQGWIKG